MEVMFQTSKLFIISQTLLHVTLISVSYTHLDVYKRQVIESQQNNNNKCRFTVKLN